MGIIEFKIPTYTYLSLKKYGLINKDVIILDREDKKYPYLKRIIENSNTYLLLEENVDNRYDIYIMKIKLLKRKIVGHPRLKVFYAKPINTIDNVMTAFILYNYIKRKNVIIKQI